MDARLAHIETWIFDLDNTLYPAASNLFGQIDVRMAAFIARALGVDADEARRVQKSFFHSHGMTLKGLMDAHGVCPHAFLDFVHDIDLDVLEADRALVEGMARLPGRKLVFTNADAPYAQRVLTRLGLADAFEAVHDIHATGYVPKPDAAAYRGFVEAYAIDPARALFVEDMARNLIIPKAMGMTTVWVNNGSESAGLGADWDAIDIEVDDVGQWLHQLTGDDVQ